MTHAPVYRCQVLRWLDGDTVEVLVDLGLRNLTMKELVRLAECNAYELKEPQGNAARDRSAALCPVGSSVMVQSFRSGRDKYGRWLANIILDDGRTLSEVLLTDGLAKPAAVPEII